MEQKNNSTPNTMQVAMHEAMHKLDEKIRTQPFNLENSEKILALSENFKVNPMKEINTPKPDLMIHESLKRQAVHNIHTTRQSFKVAEDIVVNKVTPK